eukprot:2570026-Pyramimonas_sp.AAC.1
MLHASPLLPDASGMPDPASKTAHAGHQGRQDGRRLSQGQPNNSQTGRSHGNLKGSLPRHPARRSPGRTSNTAPFAVVE